MRKFIASLICFALMFISISSAFAANDSITKNEHNMKTESFADCNNWNNFLGNPAHTGVYPSSCGSIKPPFTKMWEYDAGSNKAGTSLQGLIYDANNVYVTAGEIIGNKTIAVDKKTGKENASFMGLNYLFPTISCNDTNIFTGDLFTVNGIDKKTMKQKWSYMQIPDNEDIVNLFRPRPITYKDKVLFQDGNNMVCVKQDNGSVVWKKPTKLPALLSPPAASDDRVYYFNLDTIICAEVSSGTQKWSRSLSMIPISTISISNGKLYFLCGEIPDGNFSKNITYSKSEVWAGKIFCLDANTGSISWKYSVSDMSMTTPVVNNEDVYYGDGEGYLYCINASNGSERWRENFGDTIFSTPVISGNYIYFTTKEKKIECVDLTKHESVWSYETDAYVECSVAVDKDSLYCWSHDGLLICFRANTDFEPTKVVIEPGTAKLKFGEQFQFSCKVYNKSDIEITSEITWSVEPKEAGTISKDGLFLSKKSGKCKIIAKAKKAQGNAEVTILDIPPEFPGSVDFGEIEEGDEPTQSIEIKNNSGTNYKIKLTPSYGFIGIDKTEMELAPGATDTLTVFPVKEKIEPGKSYKGKILLDWGDDSGAIDFMISKKAIIPVSTTNELSIKLLEVKVNTPYKQQILLKNDNKIEITAKFSSSDATWITTSTQEFVIPPKSETTVEVIVSTTGMKNDEEKTGNFKIESKYGELKFDVYVKTTKDDIPPPVEIQETSEATDQTEFEITGKTEKDAKVEIAQGDSKFEVTMDGENFKCKVMLLPAPSMNKFKLIATDPAGNVTEKEITIINSHLIDVSMVVGDPIMYINGKATPINPPPTIIKGATMVPLRTVAEVFGCEVTYTNGLIQIKSKRGDNIILNLNSTGAIVNNNPKTCNPPPTLYKGKTMVPFRFIAEALGAQVSWEQSTKKIGMKLIVKP